jgi:hypothetical protein
LDTPISNIWWQSSLLLHQSLSIIFSHFPVLVIMYTFHLYWCSITHVLSLGFFFYFILNGYRDTSFMLLPPLSTYLSIHNGDYMGTKQLLHCQCLYGHGIYAPPLLFMGAIRTRVGVCT